MISVPAGFPVEIVIFEVAGHCFGVRSTDVREIVRAATLSAAPQTHPAIQGILNLRGQVVAVYDLRNLLQIPETPLAHTDHLIVTHAGDHLLALRADRALELVRLPPDRIESAAGVVQNWNAVSGVAKIGDRLVLLVEPDQLWAHSGSMASAPVPPATGLEQASCE